MSRLEPADTIEATVGAPRHATLHIARANSSEKRVYLLHPEACVAAHQADGADLRDCLFSLAMDEGIDMGPWEDFQDVPAIVEIDEEHGDLIPTHIAEARILTRADLDHFIELGSSTGHGSHAIESALIIEFATVDATAPHATHWTSDAPTSLHGNGAAAFEHTTRDPAHVTCRLCLTLLTREPALAANPTPQGSKRMKWRTEVPLHTNLTPCFHPSACEHCRRANEACGRHFAGRPHHERCEGPVLESNVLYPDCQKWPHDPLDCLGDLPEDHDPASSMERWTDRHGDVWTVGNDGLMHTPETAPFPREHVERKWGPLVPLTQYGTPDHQVGDRDA